MWKLAEDTITNDDIDALAEWLQTHPRLTQGDRVREFERLWSQWLGVRHSVMMTSGTTANFALVSVAARRVSRVPPRVGVAAVTWPTNVTPSLLMGHEVVVFDIDRTTLGIDEDQACEAMERGEIDILFVTHLLGLDALTDRMIATAENTGVILLEDCCEAHGARHGDQKVGSIGLGSTFSFYFGHHISTIEGGMVSTNDRDLSYELRLFREHGQAGAGTFFFPTVGLNFRSTEINAFLGLRQLESLDARIEQRNRNMAMFLETAPDWLWKDYRTEGMSSFALPLIANHGTGARKAREVVDALGIESRPVVAGNLLRQPFMEHVSGRAYPTPVADEVHERGFYVGNGHHVNPEMAKALTDALK